MYDGWSGCPPAAGSRQRDVDPLVKVVRERQSPEPGRRGVAQNGTARKGYAESGHGSSLTSTANSCRQPPQAAGLSPGSDQGSCGCGTAGASCRTASAISSSGRGAMRQSSLDRLDLVVRLLGRAALGHRSLRQAVTQSPPRLCPKPASQDVRQPGRNDPCPRPQRLLPGRQQPRQPVRRAVLHRGPDHRHLLPADLPGPYAARRATWSSTRTRPPPRPPVIAAAAGAAPRPRRAVVPGTSAGDLVGRGLRLVADGIVDTAGIPGLAASLGVSERQLHRLFVQQLGAGPLAVARTRRHPAGAAAAARDRPADHRHRLRLRLLQCSSVQRQHAGGVRAAAVGTARGSQASAGYGDPACRSRPGRHSTSPRSPTTSPHGRFPAPRRSDRTSYRRAVTQLDRRRRPRDHQPRRPADPEPDRHRHRLTWQGMSPQPVGMFDLDADPAAVVRGAQPGPAAQAADRQAAGSARARRVRRLRARRPGGPRPAGQRRGSHRRFAGRLVPALGTPLQAADRHRSRTSSRRPRSSPRPISARSASPGPGRETLRALARGGRRPQRQPPPGRRPAANRARPDADQGHRPVDCLLHRDEGAPRPRCLTQQGSWTYSRPSAGSPAGTTPSATSSSTPNAGGPGAATQPYTCGPPSVPSLTDHQETHDHRSNHGHPGRPAHRPHRRRHGRGRRVHRRRGPAVQPHPAPAGYSTVDDLGDVTKAIARWLDGDLHALDEIEVAQTGTPYQQAVWTALTEMPPDRTVSYGTLAEQAGAPTAARAAGSACGRNLIAPFVPCHRAVQQRWRSRRLRVRAGGQALAARPRAEVRDSPVGVR